MSLQIINLPSLHNGVSQQPPQVRSPDQCEAQENFWSTLSDGLVKRPPTEAVAKLRPLPMDNAHVHEINRDVDERYVVVVADGVIRVFDIDGEEYTVTAPAGWGYLDGIEDYRTEVALTTVADYTFVVNRRVTCAILDVQTPGNPGTPGNPLPGEDEFVPPRTPGGGEPPWKDHFFVIP